MTGLSKCVHVYACLFTKQWGEDATYKIQAEVNAFMRVISLFSTWISI